MLFVISEGGGKKIIRKPQWAEFIRIVANVRNKKTHEVSDCSLILEKNVKHSQSWLPAGTSMDNDGDSSSDSSALSF